MGQKVDDIERFLENGEFWMRPCGKERERKSDIALLSREMEVLLPDPASADDMRLWSLSHELFSVLFQAVSSCKTLRRLGFQSNYGSFPSDDADEVRRCFARYYIDCSYIVDRDYYTILLIGHSHAANALESEEDRKQAEIFMREKLAVYTILDCAADSLLYGAILIGGRIAFYQMDQNKVFSRLVDGKPETADSMPPANLWKPICDKQAGDAGLSQLLAIVMKYWFKVDEEKVRKVVEERKKLFIETYGKIPVAISSSDNVKDKEAVDVDKPLTEEEIAKDGAYRGLGKCESSVDSNQENSPERKSKTPDYGKSLVVPIPYSDNVEEKEVVEKLVTEEQTAACEDLVEGAGSGMGSKRSGNSSMENSPERKSKAPCYGKSPASPDNIEDKEAIDGDKPLTEEEIAKDGADCGLGRCDSSKENSPERESLIAAISSSDNVHEKEAIEKLITEEQTGAGKELMELTEEEIGGAKDGADSGLGSDSSKENSPERKSKAANSNTNQPL